MRVQGSWIVDVGDHLIVTVDLFLDDVFQVKINLVSLDCFDVISMGSVWNLIILLKSDKEGLWIFGLLLISKELSI